MNTGAFRQGRPKWARKRHSGLAMTQDLFDLLGTDLGRIVVANAVT